MPPRMGRGSAITGPVVGDEADAPGARVARVRPVQVARAGRSVVHENGRPRGIASLLDSEQAAAGGRDDPLHNTPTLDPTTAF